MEEGEGHFKYVYAICTKFVMKAAFYHFQERSLLLVTVYNTDYLA